MVIKIYHPKLQRKKIPPTARVRVPAKPDRGEIIDNLAARIRFSLWGRTLVAAFETGDFGTATWIAGVDKFEDNASKSMTDVKNEIQFMSEILPRSNVFSGNIS
jgi:hypothetical protein